MANLSDAAPQDGKGGWMAALSEPAMRPDPPVPSSWIAQLTQTNAQASGFCDISPFARTGPKAAPPIETPEAPSKAASATPARDLEQEAFARGYEEGQAAARDAADAIARDHVDQLQSLRLAFRSLDQGARAALAQDLQATVLALCAHVLGEYAVDEAALLARCKTAAARLGEAPDKLTLSLHPHTLAQLDPDALTGWQVTPDPALAPGALRLTGVEGAVRDQPADWMRAIREALGAGSDAGPDSL